jgi:hypothetical protein
LALELINDKDLWDGFIEKSPYGLLFHKWDFLRAIEKHTKFKLLPYGIYMGEELICAYPIFYRKYGGLKMVFSPPPGSSIPYLGLVMSPVYDTLKQRRKELYINTVVDEMEREIKGLSPNFVSIDAAPKFVDLRPFKWNGYDVETHFNYVIGLEKPLEGELWQGLQGKNTGVQQVRRIPEGVRRHRHVLRPRKENVRGPGIESAGRQ